MSDNSHLVFLDLCSGLGGASQPAKDRGWTVIRVDIDPRFKPDIVADVRALPLNPAERPDVLWSSPPCDEFTKHGLRCFYPNQPEPDLSIARGVLDAIEWLCPRFWAVENVWAARPWFTPLFGPVRVMSPGHAIWSNLGFLLPVLKAHKGFRRQLRANGTWGITKPGRHDRIGSADLAVIPYEIGEAICQGVEVRQDG